MFLGVEIGLTIAVGVSILLVIYESAYPHTAILGRLPGTTVYRNIKQYTEAERYHGIVMCRIDAPIYFANTQHVRDKLIKYEMMAEEKPRFMIVDLSPVSHVDTSAMHILEDMRKNYVSRGIQLCLCNPNKIVMNYLRLSGLAERIGSRHMFVRMHDAVLSCLEEIEEGGVFVEEGQTSRSGSSCIGKEDSIEMTDTGAREEVVVTDV